jgi:toxin ParE1/3/4
VKEFSVSFRPLARRDLIELDNFIADEAGEEVAAACIGRLEAVCLALRAFPERGRRRDDIRPGLRTIGFERRALIAFQAMEREAVVVRILYGGRDCERLLRRRSDERDAYTRVCRHSGRAAVGRRGRLRALRVLLRLSARETGLCAPGELRFKAAKRGQPWSESC